MALSKIQAESMNLADTFAFTGAVSGTNDTKGLVYISTVSITSSTAAAEFDNLSTDYDTYICYFHCHPVSDNVSFNVRFINGSGTLISTGSDYGYHGLSDAASHSTNTDTKMQFTSAVVGNSSYEGLRGALTLTGRNWDSTANSETMPPSIQCAATMMDGSQTHKYVTSSGALDYSGSSETSIRGFRCFFNTGNIQRGEFRLYGVVES